MESRETAKLSEIAHYIEEMEFKKKAMGGCDKEDVLEKIGIICGKYEEVIRELYERQKQMKDTAKDMQEEYRKKSGELLGSMSQIQEYREHAVKKAEEEAAEMLEEARRKVEEEEKKIAALQVRYMRELQDYKKKTETLKEEGEIFTGKVRGILERLEDLGDETEFE